MGNFLVLCRNCSGNSQCSDTALSQLKIKNKQITTLNDERGYYNILIGYKIRNTYILLRVIGKGAFSKVALAYNLNEGIAVAIKIFKPSYENNEMFTREVNILTYLKKKCTGGKNFFVQIKDSFKHQQFPCIVTELLGPSVWDKVQESPKRALKLSTVRKVTRAIVKGLDLLRQHNIVHRDLKPDNILFINAKSKKVKLADFGCSYFKNKKPRYIPQNMSFRPPEVILKLPYHFESDVWSLGCTIMLLFTGKQFIKGRCEEEVLANTMLILGLPPISMIRTSPTAKRHFRGVFPRYLDAAPLNTVCDDGMRIIMPDLPPELWYFDRLLKHSHDPNFIDFVKQCFIYEPELRLTPTQALKHPWLD